MDSMTIYRDSGELAPEGRAIQEFADREIARVFEAMKVQGFSNPEIALMLFRAVGDAQTEDILDNRRSGGNP
jgi:hypothetical protein